MEDNRHKMAYKINLNIVTVQIFTHCLHNVHNLTESEKAYYYYNLILAVLLQTPKRFINPPVNAFELLNITFMFTPNKRRPMYT